VNDRAAPIGGFLRSRRDALQPEAVGLVRGAGRRVPGLRREEVAALAGVSPEYYLRLEQGHDHQPSRQVLSALARALRLSGTEERHLLRLVFPFSLERHAQGGAPAVDPDLLATVDAVRDAPVVLLNPTKDVLARNVVAAAAQHDGWRCGGNLVLDAFAPEVERSRPGWADQARELVAALRLTAHPEDPRLHEVVGTLSVRDADFRRWWASHELPSRSSGRASCPVRGFGAVDLRWQDLAVPHRPGHVLRIFHAAPGTVAEAALAALVAPAGGVEREPRGARSLQHR
jgi:transcriptional regulator with XRE-family HTH domain